MLIEYCFLGLWNCVYLIQQFVCKAHRDVCLMRHIRMNLLLLLLYESPTLHDVQQDFIEEDLISIEEAADATIKVLIIDAMAILQCMKKEEHYANTARSSGHI